jgi:putative hemin transport protein
MDHSSKPAPHDIRRARAENPKIRERDLSQQLGISEADLVAAHCGETVTRIEPYLDDLLNGLEAVGEVMALTRNESAVHEKIGLYDKIVTGGHNALLVLGDQIDLRIFPKAWKHGFAVEKRDGKEIRRSLQFFDTAGEAVHKIHLRPASSLYAYQQLVDRLISTDQSQVVDTEALLTAEAEEMSGPPSPDELRRRWSTMTDVHQFSGILRALKLTRNQAVHLIGQEYAWPLDGQAVAAMMRHSATRQLPIMCFVGNRGCIQIHSGPIHEVKLMGPWLNVMDPSFHLHLRTDHISEVWAVRKPNKDGHVTSIEAYGADGKLIVQFFGKRREGEDERGAWRSLVENLPRAALSAAATAA